jgi:hypothetical protein
MATEQKIQDYRIDQFFSGPGARADHWRFLVIFTTTASALRLICCLRPSGERNRVVLTSRC